MDRVHKWADAVTMHSIAGPTLIPLASKPVFLVAQLSSTGNLISAEYTQGNKYMLFVFFYFVLHYP